MEKPNLKLLSVSETARRLGVSRAVVVKWVDAGILPTVRINPTGNRWVREADLYARVLGTSAETSAGAEGKVA